QIGAAAPRRRSRPSHHRQHHRRREATGTGSWRHDVPGRGPPGLLPPGRAGQPRLPAARPRRRRAGAGLEVRARRSPVAPAGRLSAGERTGVAAARALARPDVGTVLLDAPGRGVDPARRRRIMEAVMAVRGRTVLFSTRLPEEALRWADRVVVLVGGAVHQVAPPREVLVRPASIEAAA